MAEAPRAVTEARGNLSGGKGAGGGGRRALRWSTEREKAETRQLSARILHI